MGGGKAHIWPPRRHIWNTNPRNQMFKGLGESKNPKDGATAAAAPSCSPGSRGPDRGDPPKREMDKAGGGVRGWEKGVGSVEDSQRSAGDRGRREAVGCRGRWDLVSVSPRPVTASSPLRAILLPMSPGGGEGSRDRRTRFLERRADRAGFAGGTLPSSSLSAPAPRSNSSSPPLHFPGWRGASSPTRQAGKSGSSNSLCLSLNPILNWEKKEKQRLSRLYPKPELVGEGGVAWAVGPAGFDVWVKQQCLPRSQDCLQEPACVGSSNQNKSFTFNFFNQDESKWCSSLKVVLHPSSIFHIRVPTPKVTAQKCSVTT